MTRCITCHATNRPQSSAFVLDTAICAPICTALALSHTPDCSRENVLHIPEHSLQHCPLYKEARNHRKLRCGRNCGVPRNSLKNNSIYPLHKEVLRSFLIGTLKKIGIHWSAVVSSLLYSALDLCEQICNQSLSVAGIHLITSIMPTSVREMELCSSGGLTAQAVRLHYSTAHSIQPSALTTMMLVSSVGQVSYIC